MLEAQIKGNNVRFISVEPVLKIPGHGKIDDFEARCQGSVSCPCPVDEPNPLRVGEKMGWRRASKGRFCHASEF